MRLGQVVVASPMGLDLSGLAITAERYAEAVRTQAFSTKSVVVTRLVEPEHSGSDAVESIEGLEHYLRSRSDSEAILWIGLHTEEESYARQLEMMARLADDGHASVVLPERTQLEAPESYAAFRDSLSAGSVKGLMVINSEHAARWCDASVPTRVCRPPIPRRFFEAGHRRLGLDDMGSLRHAHLVFVGRLSRRKGVDRIPGLWSQWLSAASDAGWELTMSLHGQAFLEPGLIDIESLLKRGEGRVTWSPHFPTVSEMEAWPPVTLGFSLSHQEFDGIAVSELLACGVPVMASDTTGHRALAGESEAVLLQLSESEYAETLLACLADVDSFSRLRRRGMHDMLELRSNETVGAAIAALLQELDI